MLKGFEIRRSSKYESCRKLWYFSNRSFKNSKIYICENKCTCLRVNISPKYQFPNVFPHSVNTLNIIQHTLSCVRPQEQKQKINVSTNSNMPFFDVLLTVQHLSIFILVINQLDAQNLFYNKFISYLYMFQAPCAHRQEGKIVLYSIWYHDTL